VYIRLAPRLRDTDVADSTREPNRSLGFLTIIQENNGYVGGYLVTNLWGRPLEFRLTTAVQPSRIQLILYAGTLEPYVCADLIGKTLVDKTSTAVACIFTDCRPVLDLRLKIDVPIVCLPGEPRILEARGSYPTANADPASGNLKWHVLCHPRFLEDAVAVRELRDHLDGALDLMEPFARIRQAMSEARKLSVANRA
jgi:hypothetical protein